jgi:hypothetical protein
VATEVPAPVSPLVDSSSTSSTSRNSSSSGTGNLLAAVVSSVVGACVAAAVAALLVVRRRRSKSKQRQEGLQQRFKREHSEQLPNLATTALVRAISSASTDSSGSQAAAGMTAEARNLLIMLHLHLLSYETCDGIRTVAICMLPLVVPLETVSKYWVSLFIDTLTLCCAWGLPQLLAHPHKAAAAPANGSSICSSGCAPRPTTLP